MLRRSDYSSALKCIEIVRSCRGFSFRSACVLLFGRYRMIRIFNTVPLEGSIKITVLVIVACTVVMINVLKYFIRTETTSFLSLLICPLPYSLVFDLFRTTRIPKPSHPTTCLLLCIPAVPSSPSAQPESNVPTFFHRFKHLAVL